MLKRYIFALISIFVLSVMGSVQAQDANAIDMFAGDSIILVTFDNATIVTFDPLTLSEQDEYTFGSPVKSVTTNSAETYAMVVTDNQLIQLNLLTDEFTIEEPTEIIEWAGRSDHQMNVRFETGFRSYEWSQEDEAFVYTPYPEYGQTYIMATSPDEDIQVFANGEEDFMSINGIRREIVTVNNPYQVEFSPNGDFFVVKEAFQNDPLHTGYIYQSVVGNGFFRTTQQPMRDYAINNDYFVSVCACSNDNIWVRDAATWEIVSEFSLSSMYGDIATMGFWSDYLLILFDNGMLYRFDIEGERVNQL